jgi:CheY-like chemotaxis protein
MILIVDDLAIFREPIAACLRIAGHQTMCACDGKEGLAMVRTHRPELVLLDMAMPAMDGLAFLRALRSDPAIADIPVIMLTAISDKARVIEAIRLGAREYLLKSRFSS